MLEKAKQLFKKLFEFIKEYYILLACAIIILIGFDLVDSSSRYWSLNESEGEIIGVNIIAGLKIVAGSILIGASLLSLAIVKKSNGK